MSARSGRFTADIRKFVEKTNGNIDLVVRKVLFDLSTSLVLRTPVDTGRLRANWQYGLDSIPESVSDGTDDPTARLHGEIGNVPEVAGRRHYLINNLPYAPVVEYGLYPNPVKVGSQKRGETVPRPHTVNGFSEQAPYGMVRITVVEFQEFVRLAVASL